ncbi:hypothetical protein OOT46_30300 [Aquabacterium sp. A7-Y]|uniref:hypothetical protein n=1 Tax=Aquabacterium sp. A7-Y TaxID=1349605 RepID=UPI00223CD287|nr:hypothetical protein [Aquabacterium sp. A7-Y]MCW7542090.1 hypothetical protein [Aquabacterium sp. A7-Y]
MQDLHEILAAQARHTARDVLLRARSVLERAVEEIDSRLRDYDNARDDTERAAVVNRIINHLASNIQPNLNIALMAEQQAALAKLAR